MMTQTHLLVAGALFCQPERPTRQNAAVLAGAMAPDVAIYLLFFWATASGIPQRVLWDDIYFSEPMLTFTAIGNSAPVYMAVLIMGMAMVRPAAAAAGGTGYAPQTGFGRILAPHTSNVMILFALAALTHLAGDLPLHADDAHPHFWPITDWRFFSPVSYWDNNHHAGWVQPLEVLLGLALSVVIFRRFKPLWVRVATGLLMVAYVAVPVFFILTLG